MFDWFSQNESLTWWVMVISVVTFLGTLALVPLILSIMPVNYYSSTARQRRERTHMQRALLLPLWLLKNLFGLLLVIAGMLMLVLPGQGLLTIFVGLIFLDFPGKYRMERKMVSNDSVLRSINWVRARTGKPPLIISQDKK
ncbi:MAG: hypothetical protein MI865_01360 [Proteobacteria bacterium]|nr:hypothetical protein [Pseudomonadota bacterium]